MSKFRRIFQRLGSMSDLVAINVSEKILMLAGFERLPVKTKISEAHDLPSELAGPGKSSIYFLSISITSFINFSPLLYVTKCQS